MEITLSGEMSWVVLILILLKIVGTGVIIYIVIDWLNMKGYW